MTGLVAFAAAAADDGAAARGRALYRTRCASCHGVAGRGDGPAARGLDPAPRDFTKGIYKLRSTPSGTLPTDDDLFRTLTRGMPGTAMPGWAGLSTGDRLDLVAYVKSLSPRFARRPAGAPIVLPPRPTQTAGLTQRGAQVYLEMGCDRCHGADGRADGIAVEDLMAEGRHVYPFDMTRGWKMKSGHEVEDVYRVFLTGLDGTAMPSYEGSLQADDGWALAFFVHSLFLDEE